MSSTEIRISYAGLTAGSEEIAHIRNIAQQYAWLSRKELTATLCEHLGWLTAAGEPRFKAAAEVLSRLEAVEAVGLPALRKELSHPGKRKRQTLEPCTASEPGEHRQRAWRSAAQPLASLAARPAWLGHGSAR